MKAHVAALALGALVASPALAAAPKQAGMKHVHRVFDIMRKGSKIGTNTFDIVRQGDATHVEIMTHILVKIAFINAYRYDHSESGTFKNDQLVTFKSTTDDNGTDHEVDAKQVGGKVALTADGAETDAPKQIVPASLWGANVAKRSQIFDPANGKRMAVASHDLGTETVAMNGAPQELEHIKLTGAFARDLWFDADGLVKMTLLGSDNSEVTSQLRQSTASR